MLHAECCVGVGNESHSTHLPISKYTVTTNNNSGFMVRSPSNSTLNNAMSPDPRNLAMLNLGKLPQPADQPMGETDLANGLKSYFFGTVSTEAGKSSLKARLFTYCLS
jgi:hypothetical protein